MCNIQRFNPPPPSSSASPLLLLHLSSFATDPFCLAVAASVPSFSVSMFCFYSCSPCATRLSSCSFFSACLPAHLSFSGSLGRHGWRGLKSMKKQKHGFPPPSRALSDFTSLVGLCRLGRVFVWLFGPPTLSRPPPPYSPPTPPLPDPV